MARADYKALLTNIQTQITNAIPAAVGANPSITGLLVKVEEDYVVTEKWCGIYLVGRQAPAALQSLSAGRRTRFDARVDIWSWQYASDYALAAGLRDDILSFVETALMADRTFSGACAMSWIEGGDFVTGKAPTGGRFFAGAQTILTCDLTSSI